MTATVLLTGATGYIASHTWLALLAAGHRVIGVDDFSNSSPEVLNRLAELAGQQPRFERLDVCDTAALEALFARERIDATVHFAAFKAVGESTAKPLDYYAVRSMDHIDWSVKETLRMHPPLILLLRKVMKDLYVEGFKIDAGKFVCAAPSVTHRIPELFPNPEVFDPDRYTPERAEDKDLFGWQAFGGGRHKCSGNAFALFQIKAIICVLLRRYRFELVHSPESYQDDYGQMIVAPRSPCPIRYQRRELAAAQPKPGAVLHDATHGSGEGEFEIAVDWDLCKGHGNCAAEAPELFHVDDKGRLTVRRERAPLALLGKALAAAKYCPTSALKITVCDADSTPGACPWHQTPADTRGPSR